MSLQETLRLEAEGKEEKAKTQVGKELGRRAARAGRGHGRATGRRPG